MVGCFVGFLYARRDNAEESGTKERQRKEGNGGAKPRVAEHWQNRRRQKGGITREESGTEEKQRG